MNGIGNQESAKPRNKCDSADPLTKKFKYSSEMSQVEHDQGSITSEISNDDFSMQEDESGPITELYNHDVVFDKAQKLMDEIANDMFDIENEFKEQLCKCLENFNENMTNMASIFSESCAKELDTHEERGKDNLKIWAKICQASKLV